MTNTDVTKTSRLPYVIDSFFFGILYGYWKQQAIFNRPHDGLHRPARAVFFAPDLPTGFTISPKWLPPAQSYTATARVYWDFDPIEHPIALQLGGSDSADLALCAKVGEDWGYDEINLNVGCPSDRVQSGLFGACLMKEPERVRDSVGAMRDAVNIPVTVKTRIGVDNCDSYEELVHFVQTVAESGCRIFAFHARKAWLQGLSPKKTEKSPHYLTTSSIASNAIFQIWMS